MKKWLYLLLTLFLAAVEIAFLPLITVRVPALVLLATVLSGLKVNSRFGLLTGIVGGLALDLFTGFAIPQMAICYGLIGLLAGLIAVQMFDLGCITYLLATLVATVLANLLATFFSLAFNYPGWHFSLNLTELGQSIAVNMVTGILFYYLFLKVMPKED